MVSELEVLVFGAAVTTISTVVTAWMAWETRRMTGIALSGLELERSPILGFRRLDVAVASVELPDLDGPWYALNAVTLRIQLHNPSRVRIRYTMTELEAAIEGRVCEAPSYSSVGGEVLPGTSVQFYCPAIVLSPPITDFPSNGELSFLCEYRAVDADKIFTLVENVRFTLSSPLVGAPHRWIQSEVTTLTRRSVAARSGETIGNNIAESS